MDEAAAAAAAATPAKRPRMSAGARKLILMQKPLLSSITYMHRHSKNASSAWTKPPLPLPPQPPQNARA